MKKRAILWIVPVAVLVPILVFASVWVSRINRHVNDYTYHPALDTPGPGVDMQYDDVFGIAYLRWCNLLNDAQCAVWHAPDGVSERALSVTTRDGAQIGGHILEPVGTADETLPTILYCHGGAFFLTMMPFQLDHAAAYAEALHCRVLVPQYRLAPDHPYPTPVNDCYDTLQAAILNGSADVNHITILGDSAGGCLATEVTRMCLDEKLVTPVAQLLIYPVTDTDQTYASLTSYAYAPWPMEANRTMWKLYLNGYDPTDHDYAVPMLREDFNGFPPTYVEAAEIDILCDQDLAYADKMAAAGVDVTKVLVPGAYHGYDGNLQNTFVREQLNARIEWLSTHGATE